SLARIDANPAFVDEIRQRLRTKLFVPEAGETPKIADYTGRGPLGAWVRVAAMRTALNLRRGVVPESVSAFEDVASPVPANDLELELIKGRYAPALRDAFRQALHELPER